MAKYFDKPIRRSQLISPFGIGAMIDFPKDVALMIAGLDAWPKLSKKSSDILHEERLQSRLGVYHFRLPPDYDSTGDKVPTVRFPRWHYCPLCKKMEKIDLYRGDKELRCRYCERDLRKKVRLIPVRFVTVCQHGHISDFPFDEWAHREKDKDPNVEHILRYTAGASSTLSGIKISCSCGASYNMRDAFDKEVFDRIGIKCDGHRPWLGQIDKDYNCGDSLHASQRGASNIYFPVTYSSIYLPLWAEKTDISITRILENPKVWGDLTCYLEDGRISRNTCNIIANSIDVDTDEFYAAAVRKYSGKDECIDVGEESFRHAEYEAFLNERGSVTTDLYVKKADINNYDEWIRVFFKNIILVEKLRETRVLSGFTRLLPPGEINDSGDKNLFQDIKISTDINWLPAIIVRGEGVFIEFKEDTIDKWIKESSVEKRISELMHIFNKSRIDKGISSIEHSAKFFLLHSFAHILIKQLCFDCGYGSAALRERIYCNSSGSDKTMQGVLIYTAAGDSEGTMGGLVRQGDAGRLERTIKRALQDAMWCGSDPVCIESSSQGTSNSNLAACHSCCLLPETSCEQGNRFLDRAVLIGKPDNRKMGFFNTEEIN